MGRASRMKQARRAAAQAEFSVLSPGMLEVLSIGKGDLKIEVGDSNEDRAKAQRIIEEMLRKGYTLLVETADGLLKVTKFLPDAMVYVVADTPDVVPAAPEPDLPAKPAAQRRGKRTVPVAGSRTTAIGRTAGG
jgi:hypothetical protein